MRRSILISRKLGARILWWTDWHSYRIELSWWVLDIRRCVVRSSSSSTHMLRFFLSLIIVSDIVNIKVPWCKGVSRFLPSFRRARWRGNISLISSSTVSSSSLVFAFEDKLCRGHGVPHKWSIKMLWYLCRSTDPCVVLVEPEYWEQLIRRFVSAFEGSNLWTIGAQQWIWFFQSISPDDVTASNYPRMHCWMLKKFARAPVLHVQYLWTYILVDQDQSRHLGMASHMGSRSSSSSSSSSRSSDGDEALGKND